MPGGQFCHLLPLGIQALPLGRVKGLLGGQDALQGIQLLGRVLGCPGVLVRGFLKSRAVPAERDPIWINVWKAAEKWSVSFKVSLITPISFSLPPSFPSARTPT